MAIHGGVTFSMQIGLHHPFMAFPVVYQTSLGRNVFLIFDLDFLFSILRTHIKKKIQTKLTYVIYV